MVEVAKKDSKAAKKAAKVSAKKESKADSTEKGTKTGLQLQSRTRDFLCGRLGDTAAIWELEIFFGGGSS